MPISSNAAWRSLAGAKKGLVAAVLAFSSGSGSWKAVLGQLYVNVTLSKEYKQWKKLCELPLAAQRTDVLVGEVSVDAVFYFPSRRGDLSNKSKVLLDLLEGVCYRNDSQVFEEHYVRKLDKENPRVEVVVTALVPELFTSDELADTEHAEF